jgi:Na+-transporting NADH:ubiquinone oxidoreductase subunit C
MKKDSIPYVLGFMLAISVFFGAGVSLVHHGTKDILARNEQLHRNRTIAQAFSLDVVGTNAAAFEQAVKEHIREWTLPAEQRNWTVFQHIPLQENSAPGDIGFVFQGQGVWDVIRGIIVLTPDLNVVRNLRFLGHSETPGLGGRIEEEWFLTQFQGLSIAWDRPQDSRVIIGTALEPDATNRIDAITGATGTSQALMRMLNEDLHRFREAYQGRRQNENSRN